MTLEEYERLGRKSRKGKEILKGFDYQGLNFQIDSESRTNIAGKALSLTINPDIMEVKWITNSKDSEGNDIIYTFSRDEFMEFARQVEQHYENILFKLKQ